MNKATGFALKQSDPVISQSDSLYVKRFRALVSAHSAILWTTDGSGNFVERQPGWESYTGQPWEEYRERGGFEKVHPDDLLELTGWSREEVVGHDYFDKFIQGTSDIQKRFYAAIESGDIFPHAENEIVARDGARRMIAWDNTVLCDADGKIIGAASIGRDVTEQRRLLETLRASEERLRTLVEAMPQLVWSTKPDAIVIT